MILKGYNLWASKLMNVIMWATIMEIFQHRTIQRILQCMLRRSINEEIYAKIHVRSRNVKPLHWSGESNFIIFISPMAVFSSNVGHVMLYYK